MVKRLFFLPSVEEQIKNIQRDLHLNMNGVVSGNMTDAGLGYKVIYGTQWPELKKIASKYPQNANLAECLWKMDVRETKILATLLYPVEEFTEQRAEMWIETLTTEEMAAFLAMNLLSKTPCAQRKMSDWAISENKMTRVLAYNLLLHLSDKMDECGRLAVSKKIMSTLVDERCDDTKGQLLMTLKKLGIRHEGLAESVLEEMKRLSVPGEIREDYANCLNFYCD